MSAVQDQLSNLAEGSDDRVDGRRDEPARGLVRAGAALAPGVLLAGAIAGCAFAAREIPVLSSFSPIILAIVAGMTIRSVFCMPARAQAGIAFAAKRLMRLAIILLGLQLTVGQVVGIGLSGVIVIAASLGATFAFTSWMGRLLGVDPKLAQLVAAGTSICGASAIAATNAVTRADDEDVAYAIACVTAFGSIAMFAYPLLAGPLGLDAHAYGLWAGASIHEVAQVVAAAFDNGPQSGEAGVVAKLTRVMMLAPMVAALSMVAARRADGVSGKAPAPWFVLGFVAMVALNSVAPIPEDARSVAGAATTALLTVALAAMGLGADMSKLKAKGAGPLALGLASSLFIACFALALVKFMG